MEWKGERRSSRLFKFSQGEGIGEAEGNIFLFAVIQSNFMRLGVGKDTRHAPGVHEIWFPFGKPGNGLRSVFGTAVGSEKLERNNLYSNPAFLYSPSSLPSLFLSLVCLFRPFYRNENLGISHQDLRYCFKLKRNAPYTRKKFSALFR